MDRIFEGIDEAQKQRFFRAINQHIEDKKAAKALEEKKAGGALELSKKRDANVTRMEKDWARREIESRARCLKWCKDNGHA